MKTLRTLLVCTVTVIMFAAISHAQSSAADILRQGLLGAGSGAIGGAVSGGKSENLWISALTGAGVNIVGGSVLDVITGDDKPRQNSTYHVPQGNTYYVPQQSGMYQRNNASPNNNSWYHIEKVIQKRGYAGKHRRVYIEGFKDGYKEGYIQAVREYEGY